MGSERSQRASHPLPTGDEMRKILIGIKEAEQLKISAERSKKLQEIFHLNKNFPTINEIKIDFEGDEEWNAFEARFNLADGESISRLESPKTPPLPPIETASQRQSATSTPAVSDKYPTPPPPASAASTASSTQPKERVVVGPDAKLTQASTEDGKQPGIDRKGSTDSSKAASKLSSAAVSKGRGAPRPEELLDESADAVTVKDQQATAASTNDARVTVNGSRPTSSAGTQPTLSTPAPAPADTKSLKPLETDNVPSSPSALSSAPPSPSEEQQPQAPPAKAASTSQTQPLPANKAAPTTVSMSLIQPQQPTSSPSQPQLLFPLSTPYAESLYPLPPKQPPPAGKHGKKRKSSNSVGNEGALPKVDLFDLQIRVNANPLWSLVRGARKCLGTADWKVAHNELRFNRAMQRIDDLKSQNRWSFRQPKKQRGPPLTKSHWDWMLDEMKWMQTDFREERKYKIAIAHEMALWVQEWHQSDDRSRLCVQVGQPKYLSQEEIDQAEADALMVQQLKKEQESVGFAVGKSHFRGDDADAEGEMDVDADGEADEDLVVSTTVKTVVDDGDEDVDAILGSMRHSVTPQKQLAPKQTSAALDEALDDLSNRVLESTKAAGVPLTGEEKSELVEAKVGEALRQTLAENGDEDADGEADADADGEADADGDAEMVDISQPAVDIAPGPPLDGKDSKKRGVDAMLNADGDVKKETATPSGDDLIAALKEGAGDATLAQAAVSAAAEDTSIRDGQLKSVRDFIGTLGPSTISVDLSSVLDPSSLTKPLTLSELFPDFESYIFTDPPAPSESLHSRTDGRDKRVDEATSWSGKLAHTSRLLDINPLLVSTLDPATHRHQGEWDDLTEVLGDNEPIDYRGEGSSNLQGLVLFAGKKIKDTHYTPIPKKPLAPHNAAVRLSHTLWQPEDDMSLQVLCTMYAYNWTLISDAFNTSRHTLSIDRRSPWDCFQRWNKKWNPNPIEDPPAQTEGMTDPPPIPGEDSGSQQKKRKLNPEDANKAGMSNSQIPSQEIKLESKKKLRHAKLYEAMRKTAKRRDLANRKPSKNDSRRPLTTHESHHQFQTGRPTATPQELSHHKSERDRQYREALEQHRNQAQMQRAAGMQNMGRGGPIPPNGIPRQVPPAQAAQFAQQLAARAHAGLPNGLPNIPPGTQLTPQQIAQYQQMRQDQQIRNAQQAAMAQAQAARGQGGQLQQQGQQGSRPGTPVSRPASAAASGADGGGEGAVQLPNMPNGAPPQLTPAQMQQLMAQRKARALQAAQAQQQPTPPPAPSGRQTRGNASQHS